jgi:RNA polymerase sigma-70 factor (ECF subfamily)
MNQLRLSQGLDDEEQKPRNELLEHWLSRRPRYLRLATKWHCGNADEAEDALSQVELKLVELQAEAQPEPRKPEAWLTTCLRNVCRDTQRRASCRPLGHATGLVDVNRIAGEVPATAGHCPDRRAEAAELAQVVLSKLLDLPPRLVGALWLRAVHGCDYREIATRLGVTQATARKRVQLARLKVREFLEEDLSPRANEVVHGSRRAASH